MVVLAEGFLIIEVITGGQAPNGCSAFFLITGCWEAPCGPGEALTPVFAVRY